MWLAPEADRQWFPVVEEVLLLVVAELYPDLSAAEPEGERELFPAARQGGRERQLSVEIADAAEPEDECGPYAGG